MENTYTKLLQTITTYVDSIFHNAAQYQYDYYCTTGILEYLFQTTIPRKNILVYLNLAIEDISQQTLKINDKDNNTVVYEITEGNSKISYIKLATKITTYMLCINALIRNYIDIPQVSLKTTIEILQNIEFNLIKCTSLCEVRISNDETISDIHETLLTCWELLNTLDIKTDLSNIYIYQHSNTSVNLEYRLTPATNDILSLV